MNATSPARSPKSEVRSPNAGTESPAPESRSGDLPQTSPDYLRISAFGIPSSYIPRHLALARSLLILAACVCLTGCFGFLKPAQSTARHFVLTPLPAAGPATMAPGALAIGVGQVKLPAYLFNTSLAVRKGTNEIEYLVQTLWAERLDTGLQRVLAANLSSLLSTDQIRLSAWRSEDVGVEVYVTIGQFDVDSSGRAVLLAWWRVMSPGGEKILKAGEGWFTREGPSPDTHPSAAIGTLSGLVANLSRQLAQALKESTPTLPPAPGAR